MNMIPKAIFPAIIVAGVFATGSAFAGQGCPAVDAAGTGLTGAATTQQNCDVMQSAGAQNGWFNSATAPKALVRAGGDDEGMEAGERFEAGDD